MVRAQEVLATFAVILVFVASCGGNAGTLSGNPEIADNTAVGQPSVGFDSLASPREASEGASVVTLSTGTRSYLSTTAVYLNPGQHGVTQESPDFHLVFAPSVEELTHTFFVIFNGLEDGATTFGQASLDMEWMEGGKPDGSEGMYVGLPDYENNKWVWRGPATSASDIMDFAGASLNGNPELFGRSKVALVNYSQSQVKLKYINFTTSNPADQTGDESVYFITNTDGQSAIEMAYSSNLDGVITLITTEPGVEFDNLQVVDSGSGPMLVFDRRETGGFWEVWNAYLDGSSPEVRYSGSEDMRFGGINPDKSYEFILTGADGEYSSVQSREPGSAVMANSFEIPGVFTGGTRWYQLNDMAVSLFGPGLDEFGNKTAQIYYANPDFEWEYCGPVIHTPEGIEVEDPYYFVWEDGTTFSPRLTLYSSMSQDNNTTDIRAYFTGQTFTTNNKVFIGSELYDLRYPSVSLDNKLLSLVACEPGMSSGELYVQSSFLRELESGAAITDNVAGAAVWYDPTPPVF